MWMCYVCTLHETKNVVTEVMNIFVLFIQISGITNSAVSLLPKLTLVSGYQFHSNFYNVEQG